VLACDAILGGTPGVTKDVERGVLHTIHAMYWCLVLRKLSRGLASTVNEDFDARFRCKRYKTFAKLFVIRAVRSNECL
jgi:hypothetical protein